MFTGLLAREYHDLHLKSRQVCNKTRSPPASRLFKGQDTKHTTVKWPIPENRFKGYYLTARVDFGVAISINLLFSPDILGFRKALEHNAMSSSVSVVRRKKVLNACEI